MVFGVGAFLPLDANAVRTKLRGWRSQWLDGFSRRGLRRVIDGWLVVLTTVLPVQATLKPYKLKHQITHLGRVDIVIGGNFLFLKIPSVKYEERGNPDGREGPDLSYLTPS